MLEFMQKLFVADFMPHGQCLLWQPAVLWTHVGADVVTTLAYYCIPFGLVYLIRKREDLAFSWIFWMFGAFIFACGTTHLIAIYTMWVPAYRFEGVVKVITALLSVGTAVALIPLIPKALKIPSAESLRQANTELEAEIVQRKEVEAALRQSEARLEAVLEHLPEGVCLLDKENRLMMANEHARHDLDILIGELAPGQKIDQIGEHAIEDLLERPETGLTHEVLTGERIYEMKSNRVMVQDTEPVSVLLLSDVTEEREMNRKIQEQERLATVGQMAAGIAHDFNNLLSVILGTSQIFGIRKDMPEAVQEAMKNISEQGQRAALIVRQFLDFSSQSVARREVVDLEKLLKDSMETMSVSLTNRVALQVQWNDEGYAVAGNPGQLKQVLENLLDNARDATLDGGDIVIGVKKESFDRAEDLPTSSLTPGSWIAWSIADKGEGMSVDILRHIFEPFFTTKAPNKGNGLGLAQVYGIVKQHGGEIIVESQPDQGSVFTIYLPLHQEEIAQA